MISCHAKINLGKQPTLCDTSWAVLSAVLPVGCVGGKGETGPSSVRALLGAVLKKAYSDSYALAFYLTGLLTLLTSWLILDLSQIVNHFQVLFH